MTVKLVKTRSLIGKLPGYSNTVYDGYTRYITVDGKRFADVIKFKGGHWQAYECDVNRRERRPRVWRGNTQRELIANVKADITLN